MISASIETTPSVANSAVDVAVTTSALTERAAERVVLARFAAVSKSIFVAILSG
jgi:hypothetical protein